MTNNEQVKNEFYKEATSLVSSFPEVLKAFEQEWQSGKFREAYLIVHNAIRQLELNQSAQQKKIWEDFYWLFVN